MRYYKYPWKSATVIISSVGVLLCVANRKNWNVGSKLNTAIK